MTDKPDKKKKPLKSHSKDEIIKILREENPPIKSKEKYNPLMLILELKKISSSIGIIKGEYYDGDNLEYRGSLLIPLGQPNQSKPTEFDNIEIGKNKFYGFTLDSREKKLGEKVGDFFRRSFEDSTIQDFIPFAPRRRNE